VGAVISTGPLPTRCSARIFNPTYSDWGKKMKKLIHLHVFVVELPLFLLINLLLILVLLHSKNCAVTFVTHLLLITSYSFLCISYALHEC